MPERRRGILRGDDGTEHGRHRSSDVEEDGEAVPRRVHHQPSLGPRELLGTGAHLGRPEHRERAEIDGRHGGAHHLLIPVVRDEGALAGVVADLAAKEEQLEQMAIDVAKYKQAFADMGATRSALYREHVRAKKAWAEERRSLAERARRAETEAETSG